MLKSNSRRHWAAWGPAPAAGRAALEMCGATVLAALTLAALTPSPASAQDFTITTGQTVGPRAMTNVGDRGVIEVGGTISTGNVGVGMQNDDQTLENAGTIATSGFQGYGIYSTGAKAVMGNSGTITTSGNNGHGIRADGADAAVTNSGTITTSAGFGYGINSTDAHATITNSGTIATLGGNSYGIISTGANATITNSGAIATSTNGAHGIFSASINATITNSGTLATLGTQAHGISAGANAAIANIGTIMTSTDFAHGILATGADANISNSGTITTSGANGVGIYSSGSNATVTNSGTIATSRSVAYGIYATGADTTVINSGSIFVEQANAIHFTSGGATLDLLAGSIIQGGLRFAGTGNTLNFAPGQNAVMQLTGPGSLTVTAGGNPFVVTSTAVAVLDRAGFVLAGARKASMALGLAGDLAAGTAHGPQQCLPVPGSNDCAMTAWLGGFGSFEQEPASASLGGFEQRRGGGLMGLEFSSGGGIFVGAVGANGSAGGNHQSSLRGAVTGGHVSVEQDGYFADFYASLGILQVQSARIVLDNSVAGGVDSAEASQTAHFLSPAMTLGRAFVTGAGTLTPSLRLRYTGLQLGGYAESGASGLVVDSRMVHELELRAQLQLALTPQQTEHGTLSTTLRAGADLIHQHNEDVSGQLLGQPISFTTGGDSTRLRGFAAAEFGNALTGGATLFGGLEAGLDTEGGYSGTAQAGIRGAF